MYQNVYKENISTSLTDAINLFLSAEPFKLRTINCNLCKKNNKETSRGVCAVVCSRVLAAAVSLFTTAKQ